MYNASALGKLRFRMHKSVLLEEILSCFHNKIISIFIDGTVGFGGHAAAIMTAHPEIQTYYALDRDTYALAQAKERLKTEEHRVIYLHACYSQIAQFTPKADGILLDLGVSSMQLDQPERGFSFSKEGPLDMRMDSSQTVTAATILHRYSEPDLGRIFREFGEERHWRACAREIVASRKQRRLVTTQDLVEVLRPVLGPVRGPIHPATRIFQGLRIEVNRELEELEKGLISAMDHLHPGGRLAVISFHSLEDRIVKHRFKAKKDMQLITKKPITASREEVRSNPRARSAKLRCIEKWDSSGE